jgi:hypothetical protein
VYMTFPTANWQPLEAVLPLERCAAFMYMGCAFYENRPIHLYKHSNTRRYLNLDETGQAYAYHHSPFNVKPIIEQYLPISREEALSYVLS